MKKFGWAYLGCGYIAHLTASELASSEMCDIVSVWNRTYDKAVAFAQKNNCTAYLQAKDAICAPGVDGVYIAVTADIHYDLMKLCIEHHKPVLCEKPFTVNRVQAQEIFDLAQRENVYVSEAMWTWHNQVALKVKEWLSTGQIGTVTGVKSEYHAPVFQSDRPSRLKNPHQIGGALLDVGVYPLRYCYELFGMPEKTVCTGQMHGGVDSGEHVCLHYHSFTADLDVNLNKASAEYFEICGTRGTITVPLFHMAQQAVLTSENPATFTDQSLRFAVQFENVAAEIRSGRLSGQKITRESTLDVMALMDECRLQMGLTYPCEEKERSNVHAMEIRRL